MSFRVSVEQFKRMARTALEDDFAAELDRAGLTGYVRQYKFAEAATGREWSADFAWVNAGILCEIEGGAYRGGRHRSQKGFIEDCRKYTAAAVLGWRVLRYTSADLKFRIEECLAEVRSVLRIRATTTPNGIPEKPMRRSSVLRRRLK